MVYVTTNREEISADRTDEKNAALKCVYRVNPRCWLFTLYGFGTVFLLLGLLVSGFWKSAFNHEVAKKLFLSGSNDSQTTNLWLSNGVPLYLKVYMFNWTNPHSSLASEEKPHFVECGPYVFRAQVFKEDVTWNDNDTVSYIQRRRWDFVPEMSNGSLADEVTSINVVAVALAYQLKNMPQWIMKVMNEGINQRNVQLIVTETVENQLFEGYDDGILPVLKVVGDVVNSYGILQTFVDLKSLYSDFRSMLTFSQSTKLPKDGTTTPSPLIDRLQKLENIKDQFGWWYQKNLTDTHHFNVHTGQGNINALGEVHTWDYKTECRNKEKIQGSLGELWPMNVTLGERALLFVPDMCSSFDLIKTGSKEVDGIEGIEFVGLRETMGPSVARKPNTYVDAELLTGIRNITSIVKAPIFISFPHFYEADEVYRQNVSGLQPIKEKHEFRLVFQKDSGVILEGSGKIQINVMLEPVEEIDLVANLPTLLFPTIWFEQTAIIPPFIKQQIKFGFVVVPFLLTATGLIFTIVGLSFLVSGFVFVYLRYRSRPYKKALNYLNIFVLEPNQVTITVQKPIIPAK